MSRSQLAIDHTRRLGAETGNSEIGALARILPSMHAAQFFGSVGRIRCSPAFRGGLRLVPPRVVSYERRTSVRPNVDCWRQRSPLARRPWRPAKPRRTVSAASQAYWVSGRSAAVRFVSRMSVMPAKRPRARRRQLLTFYSERSFIPTSITLLFILQSSITGSFRIFESKMSCTVNTSGFRHRGLVI
jgi:hypothetical protein